MCDISQQASVATLHFTLFFSYDTLWLAVTRCHRLAARGHQSAPACGELSRPGVWFMMAIVAGYLNILVTINATPLRRSLGSLLGNLRIDVWLENPQVWRITRRFLNHRFTKLENYAIKIVRIDSNNGLKSSAKCNFFLWAMAQIWVQKTDLLQVFESSTETPGVWAKALGAWRIGSLREKRAIGQNDAKTISQPMPTISVLKQKSN